MSIFASPIKTFSAKICLLKETKSSHAIHVWYIYLPLVDFMVNVGKYTIHESVMENFVLPIDFLCWVVLEGNSVPGSPCKASSPKATKPCKDLGIQSFCGLNR